MEITQELVAKLSDPDIKKKEYQEIVKAICDKVDKIWKFIIKTTPKRKLDWWAFSNDVDLGRGNGSTGGEFDPETDKEFITIEGENHYWDNKFYSYNEGFPTSFLWTDYQTIVTDHITECELKEEQAKVKAKQKADETQAYRERILDSIRSKLNEEELKFLKIKVGKKVAPKYDGGGWKQGWANTDSMK